MRSLLRALIEHPSLGPMVAHHRRVPASPARFAEPRDGLSRVIREALCTTGVGSLYRHQAEALDEVRRGHHVLTVTPTASGKTLVFALPVLEGLLRERDARALFVYPTKALAQDQVAGLRDLARIASVLRPPRFEIYDGDTPTSARRRIKADPPEGIVTNPDMLHMGLLAHHTDWERFLSGLRWVVLDELHVYRGVFGAHVHHVLRRLRRICARLGAFPRFLAASATIGNPSEFAATLVGEPFEVVDRSGAPTGAREVLFLNPVGVSPYTVALRVVAEAAGRGFRTIAFTKARRVTELLHTWLLRQHPELAGRVAPYRAGYLPEERRRIEARLFRGDLLAVVSTSALELGIDVGGLDVCVLVGYPGSLTSAWQRIGRVGRGQRDALVVLVALPDALDQYLVSHPDEFFSARFESAVVDPWNPVVAAQHLECAAVEHPLSRDELRRSGRRAQRIAETMESEGRLLRDAEGERWYSLRRRPHRDVHPRSAGEPFTIVGSRDGRILGTVDGMRVYHECHPGAVYLHAGSTYRVLRLDEDARRVEVERASLDYYTVVLGDKETEILETLEERALGGHRLSLGRLKVTVRIRGYQKKRLFGGEPIAEYPLDAPPLVFETTGFWFDVPRELHGDFAAQGLHFMGGLHASEHAMIALFPLLAIADRGDVGGISYTAHPQTGGPAVFVYDGVAGGAGLAEHGFRVAERLVLATREHVLRCPCEEGCPACIHSPKCGNGNKPLDKAGCVRVLDVLSGRIPRESLHTSGTRPDPTPPAPRSRRRHGITRRVVRPFEPEPRARRDVEPRRVLVFDLETQRSAQEVGGWAHVSRMGLALAVVYDIQRATFTTYLESDVDRLLLDLVMADRVVGYNIDRFDLAVLDDYTPWSLRRIRTLDMMSHLHRKLRFRVSLGHLSEINLGEPKSASGEQSLRWWKQGRVDLIEEYCRKDVELTRRLYELGRERGFLLYRDREGRALRIPVSW